MLFRASRTELCLTPCRVGIRVTTRAVPSSLAKKQLLLCICSMATACPLFLHFSRRYLHKAALGVRSNGLLRSTKKLIILCAFCVPLGSLVYMSRHFAWLSVTVVSTNCVRDVVSTSSCSHGSLALLVNALPLWFRSFRHRHPSIGSVPFLSFFRSLKISKLKTHLAPTHCQGTFGSNPTTYSRLHPTLASSSLPSLLRADHRSLCFSPRSSSFVHPCCSAVS